MMIYTQPCFNLGLEFVDEVDDGDVETCVLCWRSVRESRRWVKVEDVLALDGGAWSFEERERRAELER